MICWGWGAASYSANKTSLLPEGTSWGLTGGLRGPIMCCLTDHSRFVLHKMSSLPADPLPISERVRPGHKGPHFLRRQWVVFFLPPPSRSLFPTQGNVAMGAILTRAAPSHQEEASTRIAHPQASPPTTCCTSRLQNWPFWPPFRPSASCEAAWETGVSPGEWSPGRGLPNGQVLLRQLRIEARCWEQMCRPFTVFLSCSPGCWTSPQPPA